MEEEKIKVGLGGGMESEARVRVKGMVGGVCYGNTSREGQQSEVGERCMEDVWLTVRKSDGAIMLTDCVFWLILYPLLTAKDYNLNISAAFLCFAMALMNPVGALNKKVDAVADINPMKLAWNLKVGIVRLYEFPSKWNPREIYSMELGDRIHCSIQKSNMVVFRTLIREHELYAMKNFIVQVVGQSVRTTSHKYKLSFYTKTSVNLLPSDSFLFNPF
ncbi:hypothetical protein Ahy_B06g083698 [Arachis hypogaea]|uniref:Replication protein A 70 kDa DNA-binding subunit B/D first OB fold domain-containing protein n=1 Tax=Arachis hypogaea TaxID=3818 RepID=A0A444YQG0_ARAHY|nr:hypothetical protein Ahy_B06g083698 [Arachis hypogaea]